jgi:hypothetical protein
MVPLEYAYLLGDTAFLAVWLVLYAARPDVRREMTVMGLLIGAFSVITAHYWWTSDWWHPLTITHTKVGVEDFLMGFSSGGIMAAAYEVVFKKRYYPRKPKHHCPGGLTLLLMLAFLTSWLVWGVGLTSFWASAIAMVSTACFFFYLRRDLFANALLSGALMSSVSLLFYFSIILLSPDWIARTYDFSHLSGILVLGIPVEELAFWFLAGTVFGPFYEYWQCEYLRAGHARSGR